MKKILPTLAALLCAGGIYAQAEFSCGGAHQPASTGMEVQAISCPRTSSTFVNKYGRFQTYIPNAATPVKTIKIAFHFWQKADGSGNWTGSASEMTRLNQIMAWLNGNHAANATPSDPIAGVTPIADSKIRYEASYYFYQNTTLWGSTNITSLNAGVSAVDPSRLESLPIHVTGGTFFASGFASLPTFTLTAGSHVWTDNNEANPLGDFAWYMHLNHELGHCLDLQHTYNSDELQISHPEFLPDVFDPTDLWCSPPSGYACYHQGSWGCDPYATGNHCTNNVMGATQAAGYLSPLQMGKMHRALALMNVRKYVKNCPYNSTPWEVTANETWDFDIRMYNDIIVRSGATLTLTCKISMPNGSRIFVEPGAQLILDGGVITAACSDGMWQGIYVIGNSSVAQTLPAQGYVKLMNGAVIEHAHNAIATYGLDGSGNINWATTGGIVQCYDSYFRNNRRDVEFMAYNFTNISRFERNVFETTQLLRDQVAYPLNNGIDGHISMWSMKGIELYDNIFRNTFNFTFNDLKRGKGIVASESLFDVQKLSSASGNEFHNLQYGITISRTQAVMPGTLHIEDNTFSECQVAMSIGGDAGASEVRRNTVVRAAYPALTPSNGTYGVYLNGAQDFNVVDNNITRTTYGVFVRKSSFPTSLPSNVYGNIFTDLYRPVTTQEENYNLNIKCNTFNNPGSITQMNWINYGPLPAAQGSCASASSPAGNIFNDPMPPYKDIYNYYGTTYPFTYYHHSTVATGYTLSQVVPVVYGTGVTVSSCAFQFNPPVTCNYILPMVIYNGNDLNGLLAKKEFAQASLLLNEGEYTPEERAYYSIIAATGLQQRGLHHLNGAELRTLRDLAAGTSAVAVNAQAVLAGFYNEPFELHAAEVNESLESPAGLSQELSAAPVMYDAVPNPAKGYTSIRTELPAAGTLIVRNALGQQAAVYELKPGVNETKVDVSALPAGIYFYTLVIEGAHMETRKLAVQH